MEDRPFSIRFPGPGRTKQSFAEECDINHMLRTYQHGGRPPAVNRMAGRFGDFSQIPDLHSALNQVKEADYAFAMLPATLRARFNNDAGELLEFMADPANAAEAVELGLVDEEQPTPDPEPVEPAPEPQPDPDPEPSS